MSSAHAHLKPSQCQSLLSAYLGLRSAEAEGQPDGRAPISAFSVAPADLKPCTRPVYPQISNVPSQASWRKPEKYFEGATFWADLGRQVLEHQRRNEYLAAEEQASETEAIETETSETSETEASETPPPPQDAMAVVRKFGKPSFFTTMTSETEVSVVHDFGACLCGCSDALWAAEAAQPWLRREIG